MLRIHTYVSKEPMVKPNAFIVEADAGLVIVDTTLTMSDSKALRQLAETDANSIWLLEDDKQAAFVGDFLYSDNHAYMMDGSILRWMANLERFRALLEKYAVLYVGHGRRRAIR